MKKLVYILFSLVILAGCEPKIDEYSPDAGAADFSTYVSLGNSLTAGFADGALYTSGQQNSYANLLAEQFKLAGGGVFKQPYINTEDGVGLEVVPNVGIRLVTKRILKLVPDKDCAGVPIGTFSMKPAYAIDNPDQAVLAGQLAARPVDPGPYNNMGVPGINVKELFIPGYGSPLGNPFFARFTSDMFSTVFQDAVAQNPTFFSLWIGNNDVLTSALAGTDALITPLDTFALYYNMTVLGLVNSANSPKGVLANIPDILAVPFFTTISATLPYDHVVLTAQQAAGLNILYGMYGHPEIVWKEGRNPFVITTTTGDWVQMGPEDIFLLNLPTDSIKCKGMGVANPVTYVPNPIPGQFVLQKSEQINLQNAITAFNQIIANAAQLNGLALVDMNSHMKTFATGMKFDGITMTTQFVTGGLFSTDGVHLCPRGNAVAANYFIDAINGEYASHIPHVDITKYPGVKFP
ncbi:MAG: hypothetical protein JXA23_06220 [Bacteroidales bacterium]|nr:hypothetical protein [Bacteroidales bacterium]